VRLTIQEARESDLDIVRNLVSFYVYDLSEVMGWECPETGLFVGCDDLAQYWGRDPANRLARWPHGWRGHAFVIRIDARLAGFALVRRVEDGDPPTHEIGEFFVLRRFRRLGVGGHVAREMFDRFTGNWEVRELIGNHPAQVFWRRVISEYTGGRYEESVERTRHGNWEMATQRFSNVDRSEGG